MLIRRAKLDDLDALVALSSSISSGMTSMPADQESWEKKLAQIDASFNDTNLALNEHIYLLVLEDPVTKEIVGSSGIHAGIGRNKPFYNYRLVKHVNSSQVLNKTVVSNTLNLANDFTGETELCSLYLSPDYRVSKLGQSLSRSRFLFMHDFPERFGDIVFAELRGWVDGNEHSPFWDNVGSKFFKIPYQKADFISAVDGYQFISDLMPKLPIYLELLPDEARQVIAKPNDETRPAMMLLEKEGFQCQGAVDIFDAGPVMQCARHRINSMQQVQKQTLLATISDNSVPYGATEKHCIVSHGSLNNYRMTPTKVYQLPEGIQISSWAADLLQAEAGSIVQVLELR